MTVPPAVEEAAEEADPGADAEPEGWVCGPCQRNKHAKCRSPECTCCGPDRDD